MQSKSRASDGLLHVAKLPAQTLYFKENGYRLSKSGHFAKLFDLNKISLAGVATRVRQYVN